MEHFIPLRITKLGEYLDIEEITFIHVFHYETIRMWVPAGEVPHARAYTRCKADTHMRAAAHRERV